MENGEEREARSAYYRISEQEKYHSSRIVKEIGGVTYDTHDRETQLICESEKAIAGYVGEVPNQKLKQLYRTKDGKYFIRRDGEIEPINIETAHMCLEKYVGYWYLTNSQKKEVKEADERIKFERKK